MARLYPIAAIGACALLSASPAAANSNDDWATASDVVRAALVVAAVGSPIIQEDGQGLREAGYSLGATYLVTEGLKHAIDRRRPDGSGNDSMPSGHTSMSFAAAATLQQRNGWDVGIPAHIAAAFVGFARVKADKHHWEDVVVGAAIGEAAGLLLTHRRRPNEVAVIPWGDTTGGGVTLAMQF
jgi:membrane-associated phospholipid phosphatase